MLAAARLRPAVGVSALLPPVTLGTPVSGVQNASSTTTQAVTLPSHTGTDLLVAVIARNNTSASALTADTVTPVEQLQVGTRRLIVVTFTAASGTTTATFTGVSGVWGWACVNAGAATVGATASNNIGNSTTSSVEFPTATFSAALGNERVLALADTNASATWSDPGGAQIVALTGPPGLLVASSALSAGATSATYATADRASNGTNRVEASAVVILKPT